MTAAEKLAYAADMAQRSHEMYAASMANKPKPKNAVKFTSAPVVKPSASNKPVLPSGVASVSELPPSQRKTFGGKSKRRRLSSKNKTKRNRRN